MSDGAQELGVNLFDPAVQQCPYDAYRTLRDQAPAYRQPGTNIYVVTRYEDVRRVLLDTENFPSSPKTAGLKTLTASVERQKKVVARFQERGWLPEPTLSGRDVPNH